MSRLIVTRSLLPILLLLAGAIVLILSGGSTAGYAVGFAVIGLAGVLLVALFFYEVGRSEDRDRAQEDSRRIGRHANSL